MIMQNLYCSPRIKALSRILPWTGSVNTTTRVRSRDPGKCLPFFKREKKKQVVVNQAQTLHPHPNTKIET